MVLKLELLISALLREGRYGALIVVLQSKVMNLPKAAEMYCFVRGLYALTWFSLTSSCIYLARLARFNARALSARSHSIIPLAVADTKAPSLMSSNCFALLPV